MSERDDRQQWDNQDHQAGLTICIEDALAALRPEVRTTMLEQLNAALSDTRDEWLKHPPGALKLKLFAEMASISELIAKTTKVSQEYDELHKSQ